jgi:hypothetical protein
MGQDFGVVIGCCKQDLRYAVGCYESVRFFMPTTRVCFLYDGDATPKFLESLPLSSVLDKRRVLNSWLKENSFGAGITKMISFFESPFENFLFLDADTIVCGDVSGIFNPNEYDLVVDKRNHFDDYAISKWFFDVDKFREFFPAFDYGKHRDDYFCTGMFFAKRGVFDLSRYREVLDFTKRHPNVFKFWEMGFLNFLIFESKDLRKNRVLGLPYQLVASDHDADALRKMFESAIKNPSGCDRPSIFHFPNPKSFKFQTSCYTYPMTYFRELWESKYRANKFLPKGSFVLAEDFKYIHYPKIKIALRKCFTADCLLL